MIEALGPRPLIVRLRNFVGDAVLGVPALRLLERHGYSLQLVGKGWARELFASEGWPVAVRPKRLVERVRQLRELRAEARRVDAGFDGRSNALVFPGAISAALDMRLAGLRAEGYACDGRSWLLARSHPMALGGHALLSYWELACAFLGVDETPPAAIDLKVSAAQFAAADALLAQRGIAPGYVLVCPFANGTVELVDKTWPQFMDFVKALSASGRQVVICPGPNEVEGACRMYPSALRLEGVGLGVYNALLARAALVVANDTGPAHMAAAVGAPLLSVLGPTPVAVWAPWGPNVEILQRQPDWLSADEVLARVRHRLG
jgi:heptosyltransferase-2